MRAENELNDATAAVDERNPFATPERVAETSDDESNPFATPERVAESADASPTVGPSFFGAFWDCLRRPFDFKSRANRTEYFGWLAGLAVACFTLGSVAGVALANAENDILAKCGLAFSLAASIPGAAVLRRRLRDRNGGKVSGFVASFGVAVLFAVGYVVGFVEGCGGVFAILTEALIYAVAATFVWGPTILLTGSCLAAWATIPGKEMPGFLDLAPVALTLGVGLRVFWGLRAGTPGPNRFGAERITPKEAARREREKNAEGV